MLPAVALGIEHPLLVLFYAMSGSSMLALLGLLCGLWAEKFRQMATATGFVTTPLSFLSGTFYSIAQLPGPFLLAAHLNPFFDGLRFSFTGHADGSILIGALAVTTVNLGLWEPARPDRPRLAPQGLSPGEGSVSGRSVARPGPLHWTVPSVLSQTIGERFHIGIVQ